MKNTYKILPFLLLIVIASCSTKEDITWVNPEDSIVWGFSGEVLEMESSNTGWGWDEWDTQNDAIRF